ncbi:hypothetical protein Tco_1055327 [Tanacetum coccineum]|uniref:Integrase, catalytic region, zinc finger, CCHC-type, peptidase aspartic, catalytic n=1 Tax=Tanacetum coccineum TaxID=301880 RepID=A0ABQ5H0S1_9ASTR
MSSITAQQTKLDMELVPKEKRLEIGKCNERLNPGKIQRESIFQVVLDALALTLCYSAFLITTDVPEVCMHQFWDFVYKHDTFYIFKMDKRKRFKLNLEIFRDILKICPRVQGQDFDALPTDEEIVSFLRELGHTGDINSLNDVVVDQMHQPWRTFAALINRSLSEKTTGLDKLCLSRVQILWGMYHQKNVDYVELLWEDFIYQIDNRAYKKQEKMYYPRFTKVIIHYFLTQDKTVSWRNKIRMHTSKDDYLINTLRFVSAKEATQIYGVVLPESLTSPEMKESKAYKTYLVSPEEPTGKSKRVKRHVKKSTKAPTRGVVIRETFEMPLSKKKEKMTLEKRKGIDLLSEVALTEEAQYEDARQKSLRDFHKTHLSGFGTVTKTAPSAAKIKPSVTNEGTGVKPGVPDVTEEESSKSKAKSWGNDEDVVTRNHLHFTMVTKKIILEDMKKLTDYESWLQRIRLYYRGKENGLLILQSIDQGPFEIGTTRNTLGTTPEGGVLLGPERPRTYEDLSDTEKKRYDADVRAINIVLQGLPKDIYKLINHNIEAKAIWDNVKMLLAGENINEYYVRFHKLVNDKRNIRMIMPNIQLNSKFVNNMSPEWDRFVTAVKLNKGLKETNHEQLYAYLKQHEKHAAQDRLIIERITPATNDQLAFVSTVQPHAQSSHV